MTSLLINLLINFVERNKESFFISESLIRRLQVNCLTEDKAKLMGWIEQKIGRAATKKYIKDVLSEGKNATNKHQMLEPNIKCHFLKYGLQHQILQLEDEDGKSSYLVLLSTYRLYTSIEVFLCIFEYMSGLIRHFFFI